MKPKKFALPLLGIALFALLATPALAWWQFVANSPSGKREVYTRYKSEKVCKEALKLVDAKIAKKYPNLYPRVGSCEEYAPH